MCNLVLIIVTILFSRSTDELCSRVRLDRRRLEAAHQKYAVLKVAAQFPELHSQRVISCDISLYVR
jgi:hypothetical protein